MLLRLSRLVAIAAVLLLFPADPAHAKSCGGATEMADGSSWRDVTVRRTSCAWGFAVLERWVRHVGRRGHRKPARFSGWACRYAAKRGANRRHGRVTCRRGARRVRFYGHAKP